MDYRFNKFLILWVFILLLHGCGESKLDQPLGETALEPDITAPEAPAPQPEAPAPQPETPFPQPETPAPQPETPAPQKGAVLKSFPYPADITYIGDVAYDPASNVLYGLAGNSTTLDRWAKTDLVTGTTVKIADKSEFWLNHSSELAFDGTHIWATSYGWLNGIPQSFVYKVALDGSIVSRINCPTATINGFCEGLAWDGTGFWSGSSDNKNLYRFTPDGTLTDTIINAFQTVGITDINYNLSSGIILAIKDGSTLIKIIPGGAITSAGYIPSILKGSWDGISAIWVANNSSLQFELVYIGLLP